MSKQFTKNNITDTRRISVGRSLRGLLLLLSVLLYRQLTGQTTTTYSSPVPASNNTVKKEDMVYLDYGYFARLTKNLTNGIWAVAGQPSSAVTRVSVFEYYPASPGGKGHRLYYIYLNGSELQTVATSQYAGHPELISTTGQSINSDTRSSDDIKLLAQDALADPIPPSGGKPYCNIQPPAKTWKQTFSNMWNYLIGNDPVSSNCVARFRYTPVQPVIVEIETDNKDAIDNVKVPGIVGGNLVIRNNTVVVDLKNALSDYCGTNNQSGLCGVYAKLRNPGIYDPNHEDIYISQHRGHWGNNLGKAMPENSTEAVADAFNNFPESKIAEMDITITSDNNLVMMHDYVMKRLTNYQGDEFSFDLPLSVIESYNSRRRNETVSPYRVSRFVTVLDEAVTDDAILMLDVKDMQTKKDGNGNCVANCKFESEESQRESWQKIINQAIDQSHAKAKNLIIKTYFQVNEVIRLSGERISHVMWTPMIVASRFRVPGYPNQTIENICLFIDDWEKKAGASVAYYETNFFEPGNEMLRPFTRNGVSYTNMLHYVYATTKRRSGIFSEEPAGPRGCVNRWGEWKMKDTRYDLRPDPYVLLTVPYGNIMVVTTDRADVWKEIKTSGAF